MKTEIDGIVAKLNKALTSEIEAVLIYMNAHFLADNPSVKLIMLETALDEMRHIQWLAEMITDIEGQPQMVPATVRISKGYCMEQVKLAIKLEKEANALYKELVITIDDAEISEKLGRILKEEQEHLEEFEDTLEEMEEEEKDEDDKNEDEKEEDD